MIITALIWRLAFPLADQGWLAWFCLVPLIMAIHGLSPFESAVVGAFAGLLVNLTMFSWMLEVPGFRLSYLILGAGYLALFTAAFCSLHALWRRSALGRIALAPALFVTIEYLRANAGFLALPWASLAHSQHHDLALLQLAAITGEPGIVFLLVLANVAIAESLIRRSPRPLLVPMIAVGIAHVGGAIILSRSSPSTSETLRLAVVQPCISRAERATPALRKTSLARLESLTRKAASEGARLIVWPETAVRSLEVDSAQMIGIQRLLNEKGLQLVAGASQLEKFATREEPLTFRARTYNTAMLMTADAEPGPSYKKVRLVPFGEYIPLRSRIRWPDWVIPWAGETAPGDSDVPFVMRDGRRFDAIICWENLFSDLVRRPVSRGSALIVHLTNDNWFGRTAAARQHNLASIIRAVENRIPIATASNTGPSQIVDGYGRVIAEAPRMFETEALTTTLTLGKTGTFYSRRGDWLVVVSVFLVLMGLLRPAFRNARFVQRVLQT